MNKRRGEQVLKKIPLSEGHPQIAKEWHTERNLDCSPDEVSISSNKVVWWKCQSNPAHEWEQRVIKRVGWPECRFCVAEKRSLAKNFPAVANEWHHELNGDLTPADVAGKGRERAWWQCQSNINHVWQTSVCNRTGGRQSGCPYCAGKKVDDSNSIMSLRPDLLKEWHPTKNKTIKPDQVTCGSQKKVWWQCSKNEKHEWETGARDRTQKEGGCPFCSRKYVSDDNRLSIKNPELAAEWHPTKNRIVYTDSSHGTFFSSLNKFVAPKDREKLNRRRLGPSDVPVSGNEIVWWKCMAKGHEWRARISSRSLDGQGCPYCSGRRIITDETSLAAKFPTVARQWHPVRNKPLSPSEVGPNTRLSPWWRCHRSAIHVWQAEISHVVTAFKNGNSGCPFCANRRVCKDNNLAAKYPTQVEQMWHRSRNGQLEASEVAAGSTKVVWWQCPKSVDHEWSSPICQITKSWKEGNTGCSFCLGRKVAPGESLAAKHPNLVKYFDRPRNLPIKPSKISDRGYRLIWWRCPKLHIWEEGVSYVVRRWQEGKIICPQCRTQE